MEKLLQYAWQHRLWENPEMVTTDGQRLEVLDPGWLNSASGPDFFNSKIILDGQRWAGNIEVHLRSSDWFRHGHGSDSAYGNVILHVVGKDDAAVTLPDGNRLPTVVFKPRASLIELDRKARGGCDSPVCRDFIPTLSPPYLTDLIDSLAFERLHCKAERFDRFRRQSSGDYEQALFIAIARALGFGLNSDPMEQVARSVPLSAFRKHSDSLRTLEAILLGQAGLIPEGDTALSREYEFMRHKFSLTPVCGIQWKTSGMRPANFPEKRLRLLAGFLAGGFNKMGELLTCRTPEEICRRIIPAGSRLSGSSLNSIIINALIPALFCYATERNNEQLTELAVTLLQNLPPENNSIIRLFNSAGIATPSAYHTQAVIELRTRFCMQRRCLDCRIGNLLLRRR